MFERMFGCLKGFWCFLASCGESEKKKEYIHPRFIKMMLVDRRWVI